MLHNALINLAAQHSFGYFYELNWSNLFLYPCYLIAPTDHGRDNNNQITSLTYSPPAEDTL